MRIGQALSNSGACYKYAETLLVGPVAAGLLQFTVVEKVSLVRQVCAVRAKIAEESMSQSVDLYGTAYSNCSTQTLGQVRRETYGEGFGQKTTDQWPRIPAVLPTA